MENEEAIRWAAVYVGAWLLAALVGGAIAAAGVALGALAAVGMYSLTPAPLRVALFPEAGMALVAVGVVVWKLLSAAAFFRTLTGAFGAETAGRLDTENLKSDILSVLDDRLADMHQDVNQTRRVVERMGRDDAASEFDFDGEFE